MAVVIYAPHKDGSHDGSIQKQTMAFIRKLFEDDTLPGLHIEPINGSVDAKVRTGRVNDMYRAVLFKVQSSAGEPHYIFTGVWPHDEANEIAEKAVLKTNPVNGLPELLIEASKERSTAERHALQVFPPPSTEDEAEVASQAVPFLESVSAGISLDRLTDELGLDPDLAARALEATSEEQLLELAADAVEWQGMALVELTAGATIDDVKKSLNIEPAALDDEKNEDDRLLDALKTPAGRMQFAWLEDDEELRAVIEGGDFAAWKVFLHPEQRKYVEGRYNGSFRLSGGAGTGKTVVLLHRARFLAKQDPQARIVLTTYTRTLADAMRRDLLSLDASLTIAKNLGDPGIYVTGVDAAASSVLSSATPEERDVAVEKVLGVGGNRATGRTNEQQAWREAAETAGADLPPALRSPGFLIAEYDAVVLPNRITRKDDYLRVRRPGRGVSLGRGQRACVWSVISSYRSSAAVQGLVDFGEVCALAAEILQLRSGGGGGHVADHVLVDEGQDLTAARWQFLRNLVAEGPDDLFIAEDAQQRIYGQRITLGRYGIKIVGRSRRLSLNYRTTHQVLKLAAGVLEGVDFVDLDEEPADSTGYRSARSGPKPTLKGVGSLTEELDEAERIITRWLEEGVAPETIGILVRDQRTSDRVTRGLEDRGLQVRQVTKGAVTAKHAQVMTMHRAKGMEFSRALIFGADADLLPAAYLLKDLAEEDREEVLQRERSLFYVAATRARDELVVLWEGDPSTFLEVAGEQ
jgi:hypothetical protein